MNSLKTKTSCTMLSVSLTFLALCSVVNTDSVSYGDFLRRTPTKNTSKDFVPNKNTYIMSLINQNRTTVLPLYWWWNYEDEVHFYLYTRKNPDIYQELKTNDTESLMKSNYDFNRKTKIIVHGWISSANGTVAEKIKDAYLKLTDDNIINLDWSSLADKKYVLARSFVPTIGKLLQEFLKFLVNNGVHTADLHLIGHSLGAHVVGMAGKYYTEQRSPIYAITGLDPAYPLFKFSGPNDRLDKSDALFVCVIHTCGGYLGYPTPLGHLDFYPNAGRKPQPGCGHDLLGSCSHDRSADYFAESITSTVPFTAMQCKNYDELYYQGYCNGTNSKTLNMSGLHLNFGEEGVYYLKTRSESPFALGNPDNWYS